MDLNEMPEEQFWGVFDPVAKVKHHKIYKQEFRFKKELRNFNDQELVEFSLIYDRIHRMANRWDIWEVAHRTCGNCSEQGFKNFRNWLIGRGKTAFHAVLTNPDNLADYQLKEDPLSPQEAAWDVLPSKVWKERKLFRSINGWYDMPPKNTQTSLTPSGTPFDENDTDGFRTRYPRLSELYP